MDKDIAKWIIEYLLRQNIDDRILNDLIEALTLPRNNVRLGKSLLLRRIRSEASEGSVSEVTLEALEMLEDLDHPQGGKGGGGAAMVKESMKSAYCAVAVDCTVRFLNEKMENNDDKYIDSAKRIWEEKVGRLERMGRVGLVSESLMRWKKDILSAVLDSEVRDRILSINTRKEALKAVNGYLNEAWRDMGPPFLELVAKNRHKIEEDIGQIVVYNAQAARRRAVATTPNVDSDKIDGGINIPGDHHGIENEGTQRSQSPPVRHKRTARHSKVTPRTSRKAMITEDGSPYPPEYFRMQEVHTAERVSAEKRRAGVNSNGPPTTRVNLSNERQMGAAKVIAVQERDEGDTTTPTQKKNPSKASLMERNPTARTYRWEGSAEDSLAASPHPIQYRLPADLVNTPEAIQYRLPADSVNTSEVHQRLLGPKRRRAKKMWSKLEEDALKDGVEKFGKGSWKAILNAFRNIFEDRTEVDLKDKWRNLTR